MLLQIALDRPEHLGLLPGLGTLPDIIEIGTPLLKRFGVAALTTVREICPVIRLLADTKTVDGGLLEAELVFGAGASMMTVLSCASQATMALVSDCASRHGATVVLDTITEADPASLLAGAPRLPERFDYVAVHRPTDVRLVGKEQDQGFGAVHSLRARGFRVSLAGGIGPDNLAAAVAAGPEILVVGSAITEADKPIEVATWIKSRLP